jgi:hypothetical protein
MKSKIFTLFAAFMLLFGAKAMAQTNGDVNEDGVVNEQDITAIIQIMQDAGGVAEATKYYWYAGQEIPTSLTSNPTPSAEFTCNNWFELGTTLPTEINKMVTDGIRGNVWYAAVPTDAGLVAGADGIEDTSMTKIDTITINGVKYDVWDALGVTATRFSVQFYKK